MYLLNRNKIYTPLPLISWGSDSAPDEFRHPDPKHALNIERAGRERERDCVAKFRGYIIQMATVLLLLLLLFFFSFLIKKREIQTVVGSVHLSVCPEPVPAIWSSLSPTLSTVK